jgi:hypothetical protein
MAEIIEAADDKDNKKGWFLVGGPMSWELMTHLRMKEMSQSARPPDGRNSPDRRAFNRASLTSITRRLPDKSWPQVWGGQDNLYDVKTIVCHTSKTALFR